MESERDRERENIIYTHASMHHIISQTEKDVHRYSHIGLCDVNANVTCNMYMYVYVYVYLYICICVCGRGVCLHECMCMYVCRIVLL